MPETPRLITLGALALLPILTQAALAETEDLGNGWYEITAPLSDFVGTAPRNTQFGILGGYGLGGTFYITDVKLTVED